MDNSNQHYVVFRWMKDELHLSKHEITIYAIIYGYSQNGENTFNSSLNYLADFAAVSKSTVIRCLDKMVENELLQKIDKNIKGYKTCEYRVINVEKKREEGRRENLLKKAIKNNMIVKNREKESLRSGEEYDLEKLLKEIKGKK